MQPEQDEQPEPLQLVQFEQHELVRGKILVGKHKPPTFSWNLVALNLWNEMKNKEEEWKKEILKLQEEVKNKNAKIEKKDVEIVALKDKVDNVVALVPQMMACRTPPRVYALHLKERHLSFKLSRVIYGLNPSIETLDEFFQVYQFSPLEVKNMLCEMYLHNFIVPNDPDWNSLLYIGEIHLRAFMSWIQNEVSWGKQFETYMERELHTPLPLRAKSSNPLDIYYT